MPTMDPVISSRIAVFLLMLKYCLQSLSACFAHMSTVRYALYSTFATVTLLISLFELCQLWSLPKPAKMQFCIFRNKYSDQRDYISIAGMETIRCALYSTLSQIQRICSFAYSSLVIQVKVSPYPL